MFKLIGDRMSFDGNTLVHSGAWYTIINGEVAEMIGVKYIELTATLTSFSEHKIAYREGC